MSSEALVPQDGPEAADALLHPITLAALGLLLVNDHVLKAAWPGPVTGKLSDLAGLAFFPIFLLSAWELALTLVGRWRSPTVRALATAVALCALGFILVKTVPAAAEGSGWLLGAAQWMLLFPSRLIAAQPLPPIVRTVVVADPTDLVAVPALALAAWVGYSRLRPFRWVGGAGLPSQAEPTP
jgi:hypothetical protein